jgi:hypothetical protein
MDNVKQAVATATRLALTNAKGGLVSWRHEVTAVSPLETQVKVWPDDGAPPRYFTVKVSERA